MLIGLTASSQSGSKGGGGNYQCMVYDAEYNSGNTVGTLSFLAGTEYESVTFGVFSNSAYKQNAPCAACYTETRSSVIMIPGKRSCPNNEWTFEYEGMPYINNRTVTRKIQGPIGTTISTNK